MTGSGRPHELDELPGRGREPPVVTPDQLRHDEKSSQSAPHDDEDGMLVERHEQLAQLQELYGDCQRGRGRLALISGGPGTGKTHLLSAFADRLVDGDGLVLSVTGSRTERLLRLGGAGQLGHSAALPPQVADTFAQLVPPRVMATEVVDGTDLGHADAEAVHALSTALLELCRDRPVVLLVDDVHFLDDASLKLLLCLQRRLRTARMLLVLCEWAVRRASRPVFRAEFTRQPHQRMALGPLSVDGVRELAARGRDAATAERRATSLHRLSGGNPLLVRALLEGYGPVRASWSGDGARPVAGVAFGQAVLSCLLRWGPELLRVAQALTVLGPDAPPALVSTLVDISPDTVAELLDVLRDAGLLGSECFRQQSVGVAVLSGMTSGERADLHTRAAELLHQQGAPAEDVARRLIAAGGGTQQWAGALLRRTAEQTLARGEVDVAVSSLELALRSVPDDTDGPQVRTALARAEWRRNPSAAARHLPVLSAALAESRLDREDAAVVLRHLTWRGEGQQASKSWWVEHGEDRDGHAAALALSHHWVHGRPVEVSSSSPRHGAMGGPRASAWAHAADALTTMYRGGVGCELATSAEHVLQGRLDDMTLEAMASAVLALVYAEQLPRATRACDALVEEASQRGAPAWEAVLRGVRADIALRGGDLTTAAAQAGSALALMHADSWGVVVGYPLSTLLLANTAMGHLDTARDLMGGLVPETAQHTVFGAGYLRARGHYHLATGRGLEALADFERCAAVLRDADIDMPALLPWREDLARAHLALGHPATASELITEQLGRPARLLGARAHGMSLRVLAAASGAERRPALLREAIGLLETAGDRLELARASSDLSAACSLAGEADRARTVDLRPVTTTEPCDADALAAELPRQRAAPAGAHGAGEATGSLPVLSEAERRVALHAALGRTNREISSQLYITVSTVEQHLTHVYRKLGVGGRKDLRTSLARHGVCEGPGEDEGPTSIEACPVSPAGSPGAPSRCRVPGTDPGRLHSQVAPPGSAPTAR